MPHWDPFYGWMAFPYLDVNDGLEHSFAIGYRFTDDGADGWTTRFNRFKENRQAAIRGGENMMKIAIPILVKRLLLEASKTVFVPALSSSETVASEDGVLSVMTRNCAKAANTGFELKAITKKAHPSLHNFSRAEKRNEILNEAEYKSKRIAAKNIVIFDDFITRGDTLSHIAQAIHEANPGVCVYGVGLAKTERRSYHRGRGIEISNDHILDKWATLWNEGEQQ